MIKNAGLVLLAALCAGSVDTLAAAGPPPAQTQIALSTLYSPGAVFTSGTHVYQFANPAFPGSLSTASGAIGPYGISASVTTSASSSGSGSGSTSNVLDQYYFQLSGPGPGAYIDIADATGSVSGVIGSQSLASIVSDPTGAPCYCTYSVVLSIYNISNLQNSELITQAGAPYPTFELNNGDGNGTQFAANAVVWVPTGALIYVDEGIILQVAANLNGVLSAQIDPTFAVDAATPNAAAYNIAFSAGQPVPGVPEPATVWLLGLAGGFLLMRRGRG